MTATHLPVVSAHRAVFVLAMAQATAMICNSIMIVTSALTGQMLAADKGWATLPLACQFIATMLTTFPASFLMKRIGRKKGFIVGALIGIIGGLVMAAGSYIASYWLFTVGNTIFGISAAFTLFYRFAAAEAADDAFRPKAISLVMAGGVIAAVLGPELSKAGQDFLAPHLFTGGFVFIVGLSVLVVLLLLPLNLPPMAADKAGGRPAASRPLLEIVLQPRALSAIVAAMLGYGVMSFAMTATPLAMRFCGFDLKTGIAFVIQGHVLAMFAPSFVTGHIIRRVGEFKVMAAGVLCYAGCIAMGMAGIDIHHFWLALVLLGLGWNFLYVAGTSQLTKCYRPSERAKIQAFNDCMVFSGVAVCSLIAGTVEQAFGWDWVLRGAIVPVLLIALALAFGWRRERVTAS
ncbi:MFS transporter [Dongia mobilis]|jgi:MFS family permease|uniref:MFS transporter n=1 Tax=Dongia sp. TaxID=1977262 RepID=UPI0026EB9D90